MAASLPLEGPSLTRTTRPTSTNRLKVGASAADCIIGVVDVVGLTCIMSIIDGGGQTVEGRQVGEVAVERWKKAEAWSAWYTSYSDCNTLLTMTGYEVMDGESVSDV